MNHPEYGSKKYYSEMFSDILCDVDFQDSTTVENIFNGFIKALDDWFNYHDAQARTFSDLRVRVRKTLNL